MLKKILIFCLIAVIVLGLRVNSHKAISHKSQKIIAHQSARLQKAFTHIAGLTIIPNHKSKSNLHKQQLDGETQMEENSLISFILSDEDLMGTLMNGTDLSSQQMKKVMNFMINDPQQSQQLIQQMQNAPGNEWLRNVSQEGKQRFLQITMNTMMNQPGFDPLEITEPTPQTMYSLFTQYFQDEQLGQALISTINWDDQVQNLSEDEASWAQSIVPDADLNNLTYDDKVALFMAIASGEE